MILLEKNGVAQTFNTAAQLNHYMAFGSSGRVWGLTLSNTSNQILTSAGLLLVRGYRVQFDAEALITFGALPTTPEETSLLAEVTVTNEDASITITTGSVTSVDEIEKGTGTYQYKLATFVLTSEGIQDFSPTVRDIDRGQGGILRLPLSGLAEANIISATSAYSDGIYIINTAQNGDEIIFKTSTAITRYTVSGAVTWDDGEWRAL